MSSEKKPRRNRGAAAYADKPAHVDRVSVAGLRRTHNDYVQRIFEDLFKVQTFEQLTYETAKARQLLEHLGIFRPAIDVEIDVARGKRASTYGYDIIFRGRELSKIAGSVSTDFGQNEGSLRSGITLPNMFGRGESLTVNGGYSSSRSHDINIQLRKPYPHTRFWRNQPTLNVSLFRNTTRYDVSSFETQNTGTLAEFTFKTLFGVELQHSIQYETAIRDLFLTRKSAPFKVREHCGPKMASLLRYVLTFDGRDNAIFPSKGLMLKSTSEYSGLGGNVHYVSTTAHVDASVPLGGGCSIQLCAQTGIIAGTRRTNKLPISNLYYFGGPTSLRGFEYAGAGPIENNTALGAEKFWAVGAHFWSRLPFIRPGNSLVDNMRVQCFYNIGNVNSFTTENMRSAYGLGLALALGGRARIELNYCIPHLTTSTDRTKHGFQLGLGYEFL